VGFALSGAGYDRLGGARPLFAWASVAELLALAVVVTLVKSAGARREIGP
jgi:hypothetical protein